MGKLLLAHLAICASVLPLTAATLRVGDSASVFQLAAPFSQPGKLITLKGLAGRAVVLEFWATWCVPCVEEIPHLNELATKFEGQPIAFLAVTDDPEKTLRAFLRSHPIRGQVAIDEEDRTARSYGVDFLPMTVLIDGRGRIAALTTPERVNAEVLNRLIAGTPLGLPAPLGRDGGPLSMAASPPIFQAVFRESSDNGDGVILQDKLFQASGASLQTILSKLSRLPTQNIEVTDDLQAKRYDVLVEDANANSDHLATIVQDLLLSALNVTIAKEQKNVSVLVLRKLNGPSPGLKEHASSLFNETGGPGSLQFTARPLNSLAHAIGHELQMNVVDETGLPGAYDFSLRWNPKNPESMLDALKQQLGLEAVSGNRPVTFLEVRKSH